MSMLDGWFLVLCLVHLSFCDTISLNGQSWTVSNDNKTISVPATVPGGIYTDLLRAKVITEPYYRYNDVFQRWVAYDNWTWKATFSVPATVIESPNLNLVFHGIDTDARVLLNGKEILRTNNMFTRYVVDVRGILKADSNQIQVAIASPVFRSLSDFTHYYNTNYTVYPTSHPSDQHGEEHANFIRKMQSSFSWDWGPAFPSMGIWKSVEIEHYGKVKLRDVVFGTKENEETWNVTLVLYVEGHNLPSTVPVRANLDKVGILYDKEAAIVDGKITITNVEINEKKVRRWWPNGLGGQHLYNLSVNVDGSTKQVNVGFRTIKIVQSTIKGSSGLTFYFKVNGWPIYAKGSNLIPMEVLPERVTKERIRRLLQSTKDANMNMLRVWGGGIYEWNELYDIADEMGILIWQDMMFACALYPTNSGFLDNVSEEIRQNIRRLQHHPSIALWAGNNENEVAIATLWWPGMITNWSRYKDDYVTLYVHTMRPLVKEIDPWRNYLVSSPTNGIASENENFVASNPNSNLYGDVHFYNYLIDSWVPSNFPTSRFVSEFGFQSFPSLRTWKQATDDPNDLVFPLSNLAEHRQHHVVGNANLERKVYSKFIGPRNSLPKVEQFRIFCYLTQIHQAVSVKTAIEKFRRDRSTLIESSGEGFNMGALYWQLNDIWQAPTWASIEYDGSWKILHNYVKNVFEPVLVTAHRETRLWTAVDNIEVWAISEFEKVIPVNITIEVYNFDSFQPVRKLEVDIKLCSDCSMHAHTVKTEELFNSPCTTTTCFLIIHMYDLNGEDMSENWLLVEPPKKITSMKDANVRISQVMAPTRRPDGRNEFNITVQADAPAIFTWLEAGNEEGHFSDNGFFMYKPIRNVTFITYNTQLTEKQLSEQLDIIQYARSVDLPS